MASVLRVLIVEDDENDYLLMVAALQSADYDIVHECVASAEDLRAALDRDHWDIVLSDYSMPGFGGLEALRIVQERGVALPFILVSGVIGEEAAVEVIKSGANDYVSKANLRNLLPTVERALSEMEARFKATFDQAAIGMVHVGLDGRLLRMNQKFCDIVGYSSGDALRLAYRDRIFPDDALQQLALQRELEDGLRDHYTTEKRYVRKDGSIGWAEVNVSMVRDAEGECSYTIEVVEDISERMRAAEALRRANQELQTSNERLRTAQHQLERAHDKLKQGFIASITVFANLIGLRHGAATGNSRRVVDLARRIALHLKADSSALQDITVAALLRDIGKLTLPDRVVGKPLAALSTEERLQLAKHPIKGQAALMELEQLAGAARLIRSQHERHDGTGYPDRLRGSRIPLGARVLAVARDYEGLQRGHVTNVCLTAAQAHEFILADRGKCYDPQVVEAFAQVVDVAATQAVPVAEKHLTPGQLRSGMVLARDLVTRDGMPLLSRDHRLDSALIDMIRNYEKMDANPMEVCVRVAASFV